TPVVGMVGELPDPWRAGRIALKAGEAIGLVGRFDPALAGSELAALRGEPVVGPLPAVNYDDVRAAHRAVREAVRSGRAHAAHDVAEGGLAVALAECCLAGDVGARVAIGNGDPVVALFGEAPGRAFVVAGPEEDLERIPGVRLIGAAGGERLAITMNGDVALTAGLADLRDRHGAGLARLFDDPVAEAAGRSGTAVS
ncbi:MAG TPA: AIR synthase-related protein, partial [Solirubrobacteraceae bacterium]|nr:AIR synthase-related protein [Solirubrobacteraceae bacterium]